MRDEHKTRQDLLKELEYLRAQLASPERKAEEDHPLNQSGLATDVFFRTVFKDLTELISRFQPDGTLTFVNDAYCRFFGEKEADLIGCTFWHHMPGEDQSRLRTFLDSFAPENNVRTIEHKVVDSCGIIRWLQWTDRAFFDEFGEITGFQAVGRDITDKKRMEEELRESAEKYRTIFENAPLGLFRSTPGGRFLEVNQAMAEMLGFDSPASVLKDIHSIGDQLYVRPEERQSVAERQLQTQAVTHHLNRFRRRNGEEFVANLYMKTIHGAEGHPIYFEGILEDITERSRAAEKLRESEERLRTLINSTPDIVCFKDAEGRWLEANDAYLEIFELKAVDYRGKKDSELAEFSDVYREVVLTNEQSDERTWLARRSTRGDVTIPRLDETARVFDVIKIPLFDSDAGRKGLVVLGRDITVRVQQEREIHLLNRLYAVLSKVSHAVVQATSPEEFFIETCRVVVEEGGFILSWIGQLETESSAVTPVAAWGSISGYVDGITVYSDDRPEGRGPTGTCIRELRPSVHNDFLQSPLTQPWSERARPYGIRAAAGFPIESAGRPWGALTICSDRSGAFAEKDVRLLEKVAGYIGFALDNFERERNRRSAEEMLRASEHKFHSIFDSMSEMVVLNELIRDPNGLPIDYRVLDCNPAFTETTGITRKQAVGAPASELFTCDEAPFLELYAEVVLSGKPKQFEVYLEPMGRDLAISVVSMEKERFATVLTDITERKRVERELKKSEERFRELAENIREIFWVRTPDAFLYVSPAYEEISGMSRESLYEDPSSFHALVHPEDRDRILTAHHAYLEGVAHLDEEYRIIRPDGAVRWIWARSFPVPLQDGLARTVGIGEDITARKEAEGFLRTERDLAIRLGAETNLTEALDLLLEACLQIEGLDCGGIYLVEHEEGALRLASHRGLSASFVESVTFYEPNSPQAQFAMIGEPGYWSGTFNLFEMGHLFRAEGLRALASIPVMSSGRLVALLNVCSHSHAEISSTVRAGIESLASRIGEIISRVSLGQTIKSQSERLEETNAALRVLLRQRERDRSDLEESFVSNVKHLILPYLDKLKNSRLNDEQRHLFEILESHLHEMTSPFVRKISSTLLGLTPTEIRVAELIRQGKTSKEMADLLVISESAVIFHRQGIRRKLGLVGKSINLQAYLGTLA